MIKKVEVWILWDKHNDAACNDDGSEPLLLSDSEVMVTEVVCNCSSEGCGGCDEENKEYPIGNDERFYWKRI